MYQFMIDTTQHPRSGATNGAINVSLGVWMRKGEELTKGYIGCCVAVSPT